MREGGMREGGRGRRDERVVRGRGGKREGGREG